MTAELQADDRSAHPAFETELGACPSERQHPNLSGDLPTVLEAAPMFRRVVAGYDRFQVDTYVRWAEDELATAAREREHLLARHLKTWTALEEARQLLSHSSGGGEFLQLSRRIGTMLAAAADDAERIRAEATSARAHAAGQATRTVARAEKALADAETEARRLVAEGATRLENATAQARRITDLAEVTGQEIRAAAEARLEEARAVEQRAAEHADDVHRQAAEAASAARLHARDEIVRMLATAREQRRRADAEAASVRERLDRDAATRRSALLMDVEALEHRCAALDAEASLLAPRTVAVVPSPGRTDAHPRRLPVQLRWRSRSLRAR
jgi:hypothetical protein